MVRSKHRYITLKIIPVKKNRSIHEVFVKNTDLYKVILTKVKKLHGDYGLAFVKTGFVCKYCNEMTGIAVVKIRRDSHKFVSTVLPFINKIGSENIQFYTLRTTGTLHQAYKHLKVYQEKQLEKMWNSLSEETKTQMKYKLGNLREVKTLLKPEKQVQSKTVE